jgi:hypothetical protein
MDTNLSPSAYVDVVLKRFGASTKANALFEKSNRVSDTEILTIRRAYERFLVDYNLIHTEKEFLGYYVVDVKQRTVMGIHPATYEELIVCLFYVSLIIFGNTFYTKVIEWIDLSVDYMRELDATTYRTILRRVDGAIQGNMA